jgi:hypothetical protein
MDLAGRKCLALKVKVGFLQESHHFFRTRRQKISNRISAILFLCKAFLKSLIICVLEERQVLENMILRMNSGMVEL